MSRSLASTGGVDRASVALSAARAASGDERTEYDEAVGPGVCDRALRLLEGGGRHAADEPGARGRLGGPPRRREAPFISGDTIGALLASATPGQAAARVAVLEPEIARRDRARRARPPRQASFPAPKSAGGFDWPSVALPDGRGRDEMRPLAFVRDAEDPVFYGQTGGGA